MDPNTDHDDYNEGGNEMNDLEKGRDKQTACKTWKKEGNSDMNALTWKEEVNEQDGSVETRGRK